MPPVEGPFVLVGGCGAMARCLLALGSNLGNREELLSRATHEIACLPDSQLLARSRWHETSPIGGPDGQGAFLNGALVVQTSLEPLDLLASLQKIENRLGRERTIRWDARAIDIDVLLMDTRVIDSPKLQLPHPRMSFRRFVLEPAVEVAGEMLHPTSGWTLAQLLAHLEQSASFVVVVAAEPPIASWLADQLTQISGCLRLEEGFSEELHARDFEPQEAVELSRWQKNAELASRLPVAHTRLPKHAVPPVVSTFWLHAHASASLPGGLLQPALVLALEPDAPEELLAVLGSEISTDRQNFPDMTPAKFRQLLDRTGHGPMARIRAEDPAVILGEAIAAVCAVWPEMFAE